MANAFDFLPDATGNGGGKTPKAASWIVDDPDCQYARSDVGAYANRDNVVQIDEDRHCHEGVSNDRAGRTENVMSELSAVNIRSKNCSLEDKFCSLEKELRDIRHLLEVTKSKVPNSTT